MKMSIELDQGVDHMGRTFGYDHKRRNFITWDIQDGKIVVVKVENDDQEDSHGSTKATLRDAKKIAAEENRKESSQLRVAIRQRFQRA
jgi:major membrane immunogen (membrane-anchored lipoprotein)